MTADSGILLVDKPEGPTSRAVLDSLEERLGIGPLGHTGTLDPLASGLLVVLAGGARRLQDVFMASTKTYEGAIRFGASSVTDDREGPITESGVPVPDLSSDSLRPVLDRFLGEIEQVPPSHSAVRVDGRRAWERARRGEKPELASRKVRIHGIEIRRVEGDVLHCTVSCGKGTYIRSLARDLGSALSCGGYLSSLRRTKNGAMDVTDAKEPDALRVDDVRPLAVALASYPQVVVDTEVAVRLGHGQAISDPGVPEGETVFAWHEGEPLCRLRRVSGGRVRSDLRLRPMVAP